MPIDMLSSEELCLVSEFRANRQKQRAKQRKKAFIMSDEQEPANETFTSTHTEARPPEEVRPLPDQETATAPIESSFLPEFCELDPAQYVQAKCPPGSYMSDAHRETRERRLLKALCAAKERGWVEGIGNDPKLSGEMETNDHYLSRHYMSFESLLWPKPPSCAAAPSGSWHTVHPELPVYRADFTPSSYEKMQCSKYSVHFLKSWKVASMTFPSYLECEYPACDWEMVPVSSPLQSGYTALTAVREPLARWVSAAGELLERTVNGLCPLGPCTAADGYISGAGEGTTADRMSHQTSWYAHLKGSRADYSDADMAALVKAMVADTRCNYHFYASEHWTSQATFLTQNIGPAANLSYVMKLEHEANGLPLLSHHITGEDPSGDCSLVPTNVKDCKPNSDKIPTDDDLFNVLYNDSELMQAICLVYAQDFACFDYALPEACKGMY